MICAARICAVALQAHRIDAGQCAARRAIRSQAIDDGGPCFNLKAANGQVSGRSDNYGTSASMQKGIAFVKLHAPDATLSDLTA